MKRLALSMTILGVAWWLWTVRVINAANDRYIVAQFTNGTSQQTGGVNATLDLTVFNDIRNLSYPNHFIQWIHVTVPFGFTGSGPGLACCGNRGWGPAPRIASPRFLTSSW